MNERPSTEECERLRVYVYYEGAENRGVGTGLGIVCHYRLLVVFGLIRAQAQIWTFVNRFGRISQDTVFVTGSSVDKYFHRPVSWASFAAGTVMEPHGKKPIYD